MNSREALLHVKNIVESYGDEKVKQSFYLEFNRRLLVLKHVEEICNKGGLVVDLGASPFILSAALRLMGYEVIAYDYDPQYYLHIAKAVDVNVFKCDLERDSLNTPKESVDCTVFSEVIEHLNPYYIGHTLDSVNHALKVGGKLILTTPNIASLFRRIKLLVGRQPQYKYHIHEYTKREIENLLIEHGFKILQSYYTEINDLAFLDATPEEYLNIKNYWDMTKIVIKRPTSTNILRFVAYPIVKIMPSLRMHIVVISEKREASFAKEFERW